MTAAANSPTPTQLEALQFLGANPKLYELVHTVWDAAAFFEAVDEDAALIEFVGAFYTESDLKGDEDALQSPESVATDILHTLEIISTRGGSRPLSFKAIQALQNLVPVIRYKAARIFE